MRAVPGGHAVPHAARRQVPRRPGRLRAPGDLLPDAADASATGYADRLRARLAGEGFLLTVTQPFVLDFVLWHQLRAAVAGLWQEVGWPILPVETELLVGDRFTDHSGWTDFASHAELIWVLHGSVRMPPLSAGPGELLYRPPGRRHTMEYGERCVTLRLRIPADPALLGPALREVLADLVHRERGSEVTYVDASVDPRSALADLTGTVGRIAGSPELSRALRRQWAARRSAAGLEPAPPARRGVAIDSARRVRVTGEIVRLPDGPDHVLWAANGHAFPLGGGAGERSSVAASRRRAHRRGAVRRVGRAAGSGGRARAHAVSAARRRTGGDGPVTLHVVDGPLDWAELTERFWDRGPVLFRGIDPVPFVADEVFAAAVAACRTDEPSVLPPDTQFTVERWQRTDPAGALPLRPTAPSTPTRIEWRPSWTAGATHW